MLALRTSPPCLSTAEGERIARDVYGLTVTATQMPGERDCNFLLRGADSQSYVLKVMDAAADPGSDDCLSAVLSWLAGIDFTLPVPRVLRTLAGHPGGAFTRDDRRYATCLLSYLPGALLGHGRPNAALLENVGDTLSRLDLALRGFFHPALGRALAWDIRRLPDLMQFSPYLPPGAARDHVERAATEFRPLLGRLRGFRSQAIHGDCHGRNLLVEPGGASTSGILDFGDMIHAPLIFEPAIAMAEFLVDGIVSVHGLVALLRGFTRRQRLETAEVDVLLGLVKARLAVTLLVQAWRVRHDPPSAAVLEQSALRAEQSLEELREAGEERLTADWHRAAGTEASLDGAPVDLARRHRLLGAGAELFYEHPLHLVRGAGVWLYDPAGRAYLDAYNNVPHVGHSHPTVVDAIARQAALLSTHTRYLHEKVLDYAEALTGTLPPALNTCIFVNSGSEANDVAWRMAKLATGRSGALVMAHAYHGITDAAGALTPGAGEPPDPWVVTLPPPPTGLRFDQPLPAETLAAARSNVQRALQTLEQRGFAPAALFLDSALTSTGIFDPPIAWAQAVAVEIRAAGGLVVGDEVQYGLGRSGSHFWGFERRGLLPDIVTLGKPVGNGYPMGVVIAHRSMVEAFQAKFGFFSTFGGNAVAAAAGLAVLQVMDQENLMANAKATGEHLQAALNDLCARHACYGAVRGRGLLLGLTVIDVDAAAAKHRTRRIVNRLAAEFGVLVGAEGPTSTVLKLRPPLPFQIEHADMLVAALDGAAG